MGRWGSPEAAARDGTRLRRLVTTCWTGGPTASLGRLLAAGACVWLVYAALWLAVAGPVLDESGVAAPIIAGDLAYPPGHPNRVVYRRAPILLYQLAAFEWRVVPDPWIVSAPRNVLFLFLSAFVPFATAVACTGRPAWGHVAAALAVSEAGCSLIGVYLMWIFPGLYSTGHIGLHVAVLAVVLVASRLERLGGLLAGVLPVVHGPMTVVLWPALAAVLAWRPPRRWRAVVVGGSCGLALVGVVALAIAWRSAAEVPVPLYAPGTDGAVVLRTYVETTDPHRQPFPVWSAVGLVAPTAFAALVALVLGGLRRSDDRRSIVIALATLGTVAFACVFGTRAIQAATGGLPAPILSVMPGRYVTVPVLLLIPLAVTAWVTASSARAATTTAILLLALETGLVLLARRAAFAWLLYVVLGSAMGAAAGSRERRPVALVGAAAVAGAIALVGGPDATTRLGAFAAGLVVAFAVSALGSPPAEPGRSAEVLLAAACLAAALGALRGPHVPNEWEAGSERLSNDERGLAAWLATNARPDAMLVAPLFPPTWLQPKTGHPVLADTMTMANMAYFPATASASARIVRDLFGIDYADPDAVRRLRGPDGMLRPTSPAWNELWQSRDCGGWRVLADRYGFRLVWSELAHPVRLPVAWRGERWALHRVPETCPAETTS
jgi:hypothetical protein